MAAFTQALTLAWERLVADAYGATGRTVGYRVHSARLLGADQAHAQVQVLSANVSAMPLSLSPSGVSAVPLLTLLCSDQPIDLRASPTDAVFASGVVLWAMAGFVSGLYVTTGNVPTTIWCEATGGSAAALQYGLPLP